MAIEMGSEHEYFAVYKKSTILHIEGVAQAVQAYLETDPSHTAIIASLGMKEILEHLSTGSVYRGTDLYST